MTIMEYTRVRLPSAYFFSMLTPLQTQRVTRREMLAASIAALMGAFGVPPILLNASRGSRLPHAPAVLDPMTAIIVAKTALDVVRGFSRGSDGGLGAMLRYQVAMLGEISRQLDSVSRRLDELRNFVAQLPEDTRLALKLQFRTELLARIAGAAERYRTEILDPSRIDPTIITHPQGQRTIAEILQSVSDNRATLSRIPEGKGPQACLTAPVSLALEVACAAYLHHPSAMIAGRLNAYSDWLTEMMSDQPGSIPSIQRAAAAEHDRLIATLATNPLAQRLQIQQYQLTGQQAGPVIDDTCTIIGGYTLDGIPNSAVIPRPNQVMTRAGANSVVRKGAIEVRDSEETGARLLHYVRTNPIVTSRGQPVTHYYERFEGPFRTARVDTPQDDDVCHYLEIPSVLRFSGNSSRSIPLPPEAAIAAADATGPSRTNDLHRARLEEILARVNEQRATIAFCALASVVVTQTRARIDEYRLRLTQS